MKKILLLLCLAFITFASQAQNFEIPKSQSVNTANKYRPKIVTGGGFGLQIGSYTSIQVNPEVGAYLTDWLLVGVGGSYSYVVDRDYFSGNSWGFNAYIQPNLYGFIVHAEYNFNHERIKFYDKMDLEINNYNSIVVGFGYRHDVSRKLSVYGLALIKVYQWPNADQYYWPFFRAGVNIHL